MPGLSICPYRVQVDDPDAVQTQEYVVQTAKFVFQHSPGYEVVKQTEYKEPVMFTGTSDDLALLEACDKGSVFQHQIEGQSVIPCLPTPGNTHLLHPMMDRLGEIRLTMERVWNANCGCTDGSDGESEQGDEDGGDEDGGDEEGASTAAERQANGESSRKFGAGKPLPLELLQEESEDSAIIPPYVPDPPSNDSEAPEQVGSSSSSVHFADDVTSKSSESKHKGRPEKKTKKDARKEKKLDKKAKQEEKEVEPEKPVEAVEKESKLEKKGKKAKHEEKEIKLEPPVEVAEKEMKPSKKSKKGKQAEKASEPESVPEKEAKPEKGGKGKNNKKDKKGGKGKDAKIAGVPLTIFERTPSPTKPTPPPTDAEPSSATDNTGEAETESSPTSSDPPPAETTSSEPPVAATVELAPAVETKEAGADPVPVAEPVIEPEVPASNKDPVQNKSPAASGPEAEPAMETPKEDPAEAVCLRFLPLHHSLQPIFILDDIYHPECGNMITDTI